LSEASLPTPNESSPDGAPAPCLAAVDLGSNSFHLLLARLHGDEPVTVDRLREQVQIASGLGADRRLSAEAIERALDCLRRFGQRLRDLGEVRVRAVGTNTLRVARNARAFRTAAEEALGHPIEIISGNEEARLIYLGIAHLMSDDARNRLVVDIGGGSTECIVGERFEAITTHSFYMGCVNYTQRYFADGRITKAAMDAAVIAAQLELHTSVREFRDAGWSEAAGASGTIRSVASACRESGWCEETLTLKALRRFVKELLAIGQVDKLTAIPGLKSSRAPIIAGGAAILLAVFESLRIEEMQIASGALQEGVIYDLLGRIHHEDVRERTIRLFQERYHVDRPQALRVERTARRLLDGVASAWGLSDETSIRFLAWAARLHEVGLMLAYNHHHRHGAYLVANAEMPGFSQDDQLLLAAIIGNHRRRVHLEGFEPLGRPRRELAQRLCALLRLAVLLNRGRSSEPLPEIVATGGSGSLGLGLPADWLLANPLTRVDLEGETAALKDLDVKLLVEERPAAPA